jgi:hypothetical protein
MKLKRGKEMEDFPREVETLNAARV